MSSGPSSDEPPLPTSGGMYVRTGTCDEWRAVVAVHGELDLNNADDVRAELNRHLDAGRRVLRIDVAGVTFLDSTALGALLEAAERCRQGRGLLILTNVPPRVARLIKIAGLEQLLLIDGVTPSPGSVEVG